MIEKIKKTEIGPYAVLMCIYFLALPLTITVNESGSSFLRLLTIPIAGLSVIGLIFYKGKIELNSIHLFAGLFLISTVTTVFVDNSAVALNFVRGYFETMALLFIFTIRRYSRNEIELIEITQIILLIILILLGFIGADWYGDRNTMTLFGATCDPNYFCGLFFLPITVALKKIKEKKIYSVISPILIILGAYMIISSGSRGGLLALAVMILSYIFINAKNTQQRFIGLIIAVFTAIVLWIVVIPLLPETVSSRFDMNELISSKGTGRGDIWVSMLESIKNSGKTLFTGNGIDARYKIMMNGKIEEMVAHNQFIQVLYNQGIFGLITFVLLSLSAVTRNLKKRGYISAAMLGTLALAMTLSINPSVKAFWNLLIYAAFSFNYNNDKGVEC